MPHEVTNPILQGTAPYLLCSRNAEDLVGLEFVRSEEGGSIQGKASMSGFGQVETGDAKLRR